MIRIMIGVVCVLSISVFAGSRSSYSTGDTLADLPYVPSTKDVLQGKAGVIEAGGLQIGAVAGLTDGENTMVIPQDFPEGPALTIRYDFEEGIDIQEIRVFAENICDGKSNGRPGQSYQIEYSLVGSDKFHRLPITNSQKEDLVQTGDFDKDGFGKDFLAATVTRVYHSANRPVLHHVDSLRFVFWPVSNSASQYRDPWDADDKNDVDGEAKAFESTVLKEIDVIAAGAKREDSKAQSEESSESSEDEEQPSEPTPES